MIDQAWADAAIERCLSNGIDHFFVAPGSRCTPLTLAIARNQAVSVVQHFDERGLAFATLGYGRATGRPAVFVCTSGTAVANALPAVIEASVEKVPMLLFTADRPPELQGTGANQTINQQNIFGGYPEQFINLPVPCDKTGPEDTDGLEFLATALQKGLDSAGRGPVHFNWMFREPFTIEDPPDAETRSEPAEATSDSRHGFRIQPGAADDELEQKVEVQGNALIALGRCNSHEANEALRLAAKLDCPVLSDISSGLRTGSFELPTSFSLPRPDTILHLGGRIISKSWLKWLAGIQDSGTRFLHFTSDGQVFNPTGLKQIRITSPFAALPTHVYGEKTSDSFKSAWLAANEARNNIIEGYFSESSAFSEPAIANFLAKKCPTGNGLFVGNSMPIRDLDWYATGDRSSPRQIAANRGASGIDGLLATATGYAQGLNRPTTVVLGDLSALHDLNSLAMISGSEVPVIVVIINNQGGHIFDLLPIKRSKHFHRYFFTPHDFDFENAAMMFKLEYRRLTTMPEFIEGYTDALSAGRPFVLELLTDPVVNGEVRRQIGEAIARCASQL